MRFLPGGQPVVEHDPRAAERTGERLPLSWCRVEAVVVPEPHTESIVDLTFETGDSHVGGYRVLSPASPDLVTTCRHPGCGTSELQGLRRHAAIRPSGRACHQRDETALSHNPAATALAQAPARNPGMGRRGQLPGGAASPARTERSLSHENSSTSGTTRPPMP